MSEKPRQRVYVCMRTGGVAKAREWAGKPYFELSTLPVVCRYCQGHGRRRKQGCFGSRDAGECQWCGGRGRVPEGHWSLDAVEDIAAW